MNVLTLKFVAKIIYVVVASASLRDGANSVLTSGVSLKGSHGSAN